MKKKLFLQIKYYVMDIGESSSSGEIISSFENISNVFTSYTEIPSSGFNCLFKAQRYGKWFVLKGLKPEHQQEVIYLELLNKEFELGVQMEHPNIVHTISKEIDPVVGPCIVMEYVDGITLKEFFAQRPSQEIRLKIVKELLDAMSYYHSLQIIHRDLKPDNILITRNGQNVKLIDFGLADSDYHEVLKQPAGSNKYAAPEQVKGNVPLDNRADIYAFGIILRQLFPNRYGGIARKCTHQDREKRFQHAEEIWQSMQHRSRRLMLVFASLLLCLVIGLWLFFHQSKEETEIIPVTEDLIIQKSSDTNIEQQLPIDESTQTASPLEDLSESSPSKTLKEKNIDNQDDLYFEKEARRMIDKKLDSMFKPWWDWYRAWEPTIKDKSLDPDEVAAVGDEMLLREPLMGGLYKKEDVVSSVIKKIPQCEKMEMQLKYYYEEKYFERQGKILDIFDTIFEKNSTRKLNKDF